MVAATLIVLALLMSHIAGAQALTNGWNFIRAYNCLGIQSGGVDYLFVYPSPGSQPLSTTDATTITAIAPLCVSGDGFFVYFNGVFWNGVSVYVSIRLLLPRRCAGAPFSFLLGRGIDAFRPVWRRRRQLLRRLLRPVLRSGDRQISQYSILFLTDMTLFLSFRHHRMPASISSPNLERSSSVGRRQSRIARPPFHRHP